jgi:hypothetical protein
MVRGNDRSQAKQLNIDAGSHIDMTACNYVTLLDNGMTPPIDYYRPLLAVP